MLLLPALFFSGCGGSPLELCQNNLSEVRYNVFAGSTDEYTTTFMSGKRENPYVVNGKHEKVVDFGLLTVTFIGDSPLNASYVLKINDIEKSGNLEYNQYENNFMADIGMTVDDDADINLEVTVGSTKSSTKLTCKNIDFEISWQTALNIAVNELNEKIKENTNNGTLNGEVYVKIITDLNGNFDDYFWYISLYTINGDSYAVIINPIDGTVMAQK